LRFRQQHGRTDEYAVYLDDLGCMHCLTCYQSITPGPRTPYPATTPFRAPIT
jgi:hypothetical protein